MKKTVKITGLDCPNCARGLENEINKLESVQNAHLEFVKSTLTFEGEDLNKAYSDIVSLTKTLEPQAEISGFETEKTTVKRKFNKKLLIDISIVLLGVLIGAIILFVKMPEWAYWCLYTISALLLGYKTYYKAVTQLFKGIINENLLITISVIGATFVSEHLEGLMVIALYSIGKIFENLAVDKSRKLIENLAKLQPEYAVILDENKNERKVSPSEVKIGEKILVKPGEKVALDGVVVEGKSLLNMQSLTGESVPVQVEKGENILSGSIVIDGTLVVKVTSVYENSAISKIMNLVENASENKSKTETFISKITKYYTLGIVVLALLVWAVVWAVTKNFDVALYRGLIFLVISCPCAFAISVPLSYFSGLGNASKHGILIKGSNYLDVCAKVNLVAFDKTGTLTTGEFKVERIEVSDAKRTKEEILYLAALGEQYSLHPLAKAIVKENSKKLKKLENVTEKAGEGVEFEYKGKKYFIGRKSKNLQNTVVEVFENNEKLGNIILSDQIKTSSKETCERLKLLNIKTVMLSGDNIEVAKKVGQEVGTNEALGELLPEDKYNFIQQAKSDKNVIAYVGDGINDAPSLALSDVGISMGINGSPASIEASDIVLVDDNPAKIITAIKISKYTKKIVIENIAFSAIVKLLFLSLGAAGITGMLWAVFADVGVTLLAILNSLRALKFNPNK